MIFHLFCVLNYTLPCKVFEWARWILWMVCSAQFGTYLFYLLHVLIESLSYRYLWCFFDFDTSLLHITGTPYGFCIMYSSPVLSHQQQLLWLLIMLRTSYNSLSLSLCGGLSVLLSCSLMHWKFGPARIS